LHSDVSRRDLGRSVLELYGDATNEEELETGGVSCFWCGVVCTEGGDLKKLKVDHLKTYLRYYGLRMIGNKATLIERIQEHLV